MQMQFRKNLLGCLQRIKGEVQTQEETQELRLTEDMPDIGSVLGAWGQTLVRGKEWHSGGMEVSCGVMVWVLYQPEDGGEPRIVEAWIPFQFKWELPPADRDGRICVSCLLRSVDARVTSARKLMLRATVSALGEAWMPAQTEVSVPEEVPEDIHLLKRTYPMMLPREVGEKTFSMDEELTLPSSAPKLEKLLRFSLQPELIEHKVLSGKVAFRGAALLHILYNSDDGALHSWDFELPMAQYAELEQEYEQDATARVSLAVTSLELDSDPEGRLHLQAGLTGQYVIADRTDLELVEDGYSTGRNVTVHKEELVLPVILEEQVQTVHGEQTVSVESSRVVDVAFYPEQPRLVRSGDTVTAELGGQFQMLCYDNSGVLKGSASRWNGTWSEPAHPDCQIQLLGAPSGLPQAVTGSETTMKADTVLYAQTTAARGLPMVTGLEIGELQTPDPERPSLILRRAGNHTLWEIAKETGSTEEAIRRINHLEDEPEGDRMLLIPIA